MMNNLGKTMLDFEIYNVSTCAITFGELKSICVEFSKWKYTHIGEKTTFKDWAEEIHNTPRNRRLTPKEIRDLCNPVISEYQVTAKPFMEMHKIF